MKNNQVNEIDPALKSKHHAKQKKEMGLENVDAPYNPNYIVSMLVDSKNRVWCGTWGGGLSLFVNNQWRTFTMEEGLAGNYVSMLEEGPDGTVWIGTNLGLSKLLTTPAGFAFKNFTEDDGLYHNYTYSMVFQGESRLWVGGFGGVAHFPNGLQ